MADGLCQTGRVNSATRVWPHSFSVQNTCVVQRMQLMREAAGGRGASGVRENGDCVTILVSEVSGKILKKSRKDAVTWYWGIFFGGGGLQDIALITSCSLHNLLIICAVCCPSVTLEF